MTDQNIENILGEQTYRLFHSQAIIDFILLFNEVAFSEGNLKRSYKDLFVLQFAIRQNLIINLEILFAPTGEDYSLTKLANRVCRDNRNSEITELRKSALRQYHDQDINYIRKKYSAHFDLDREERKLEWDKISELLNTGRKLHDAINYHKFETSIAWSLNDLDFTKVLTDRKRNLAFIELFRAEGKKNPNSELVKSMSAIIRDKL